MIAHLDITPFSSVCVFALASRACWTDGKAESMRKAVRFEQCPQCDGTGHDGHASDEESCGWCNGTGRVSEEVYKAWAEELDRSYRRGGPLL